MDAAEQGHCGIVGILVAEGAELNYLGKQSVYVYYALQCIQTYIYMCIYTYIIIIV